MRTAEFFSPKHPDKICDIISDTILDNFLENNIESDCLINTMMCGNKIWISGEVNSHIILEKMKIKHIVYNICKITDVSIDLKYSENLPKTNFTEFPNLNGIALGFAVDDNSSYLPFEFLFARELNRFIYNYYPNNGITQVTINGNSAIVYASFENSNTAHLSELIDKFFKEYAYSIAPKSLLNVSEKILNPIINNYCISGANGKKNVMDNYGPRVPISGNSYSGKDFKKVDRFASYMARKIAIDYLNKHRLKYCMVELSYVPNSKEPVIKRVKGNDQGIQYETGIKLYEVDGYNLTPDGIIDFLDLKNIKFAQTSEWGHFGNNFKWDLEN